MKRRDFLAITGSSVLATPWAPGLAGNKVPAWFDFFSFDTDRVLVILQMEGGNDGLNTLIPLDQYGAYAKARASISIPENKILPLNTTIKTGLNPGLDEIKGFYNEGRIKFIQAVGYPTPNYSHFRSTDIWMSGSDADEVLSSGWAGRYLNYEFPNFPNGFPNEKMPDPLSVEIGYGQSLTLQGPSTSMGVTIADPDSFEKLLQGIDTPLPQTPSGDKQAFVRLIRKQSNVYGDQMKLASKKAVNKATYPRNNNLGDQLKIVARLIAGGMKTRVYKVNISGFDNHSNQVLENDHTRGEHYELMRSISSAVKAFMDDLTLLGLQDRVIGMTTSEFGRRIISNASRGTDHGAAAPIMLFGNAILGGIIGNNPTIPLETKWEDNVPMQYDFRSVYGSILEQWFCVARTDVQKVLTKAYQSLPVIQSKYGCLSTPTHDETTAMGISHLNVYPNPFTSIINIKAHSTSQQMMISIFSPDGRMIKNIYHGTLPAGEHHFYWNSEDLPVGNYYVRFQSGPVQQVQLVSKVN